MTPRGKTLGYACTLFTLAALAALLSSGWNNRQLLHRVSFDISRYDRIPMHDFEAKAAAVAVLRDEAAELDILTEAVRKRPYSVVLLDEVEKAHRDVMNLFYQVFDRGFMRDGEGREIDFRNTVILMTSNLGSDHLMQRLDEQPDATEGDLHELLRPILRDHFQPALLARFQTVIYRPLSQAAMRTIVEMKLGQVSQRLNRHYCLTTHIDESLYDALTTACLLPDSRVGQSAF